MKKVSHLVQSLLHALIWIKNMVRRFKLGLVLVVAGCSLLTFEPECPVGFEGVANCFYQAGVASFEKKNYANSVVFFRKVPPTSEEYQNSLKMIERIPVERAKDALASGNYQQAMIELGEVADYFHNKKQADLLKLQIQFRVLKDQLMQTPLMQARLDIISQMMPILLQLPDNKYSMELLGTLQTFLQSSTVPQESQKLIDFLAQLVTASQSPQLVVAVQRIAFANIERFQSQRQTRNALIELIKVTKFKLQ